MPHGGGGGATTGGGCAAHDIQGAREDTREGEVRGKQQRKAAGQGRKSVEMTKNVTKKYHYTNPLSDFTKLGPKYSLQPVKTRRSHQKD